MCPPKEQKQLIPYYMCLKGLYIHKLTTQTELSNQDAKPINYDRSSYLIPPLSKKRYVTPPVKLDKGRL